MQRYFRKDPVLQINPMITVFCRRQYEFGLADISRVDIQWPLLHVIRLVGVFQLPLVGINFCRDKVAWIDHFVEHEKLLFEFRPHRFRVEVRFCEVVNRALKRKLSPFASRFFDGPLKRLCVSARDRCNQKNRFMFGDFAHGRLLQVKG